MPAVIRKSGNKWRVSERDGTPVTRGGSAVDGGGHASKQAALRQARAINAKKHGKGK